MDKGNIKKSKLVPIGLLLIFLGFAFPRKIADIAEPMDHGAMRSVLFVSTDLLRACFLVGFGFSIIGGLRNRKMRKQLCSQENED